MTRRWFGHERFHYERGTTGASVTGYAVEVYLSEAGRDAGDVDDLAVLMDTDDGRVAVPIEQPLVGDAASFCDIYAVPGDYWLRVTDNGGQALDMGTRALLGPFTDDFSSPVTVGLALNVWAGSSAFDPTANRFGVRADGETDDTKAWETCLDEAYDYGSFRIKVPEGVSLVGAPIGNHDASILHLGDDIPGYVAFEGEGFGVSQIRLIEDLGGASLISGLGRHGVSNNFFNGPIVAEGFDVINPDGFKGDVLNFWQTAQLRVDIRAFDIKGSVVGLTAPRVAKIRLRTERCGQGDSGSAVLWVVKQDEGGVIANVPTEIDIAGEFYDSDDYAVVLDMVEGGSADCVIIDETVTGLLRAGLLAIDCHDFDLSRVRGRGTDGAIVEIRSRGYTDSIRVGPGPFGGSVSSAGLNIVSTNSEQILSGVSVEVPREGVGGPNLLGPIKMPYRADGLQFTHKSGRVAPIQNLDGSFDIDCLEGDLFLLRCTTSPASVNEPINPFPSKRLTFLVQNATGGALTLTWDAIFEMAAWVSPADTKKRSITFDFNVKRFDEASRVGADLG